MVVGPIPLKVNEPCQHEGGIIKRFPVFFKCNDKDSNIDNCHITEKYSYAF